MWANVPTPPRTGTISFGSRELSAYPAHQIMKPEGYAMQYWDHSSKSGWVVRTRDVTSSVCPRCRGTLYRVPTRLVDRLLRFLSRLERLRYQCESRFCGWEGNLPVESPLSRSQGVGP